MASTLRIDSVVFAENGSVRVRYTRGEAPLPIETSGNEREFSTRQEFAGFMGAAAENVSDDNMIALAAAPTFKANPLMTNPLLYSGKTINLDLSGAVAAAAWS